VAERLSKALARYRVRVKTWQARRDVGHNELKANPLSDPWNGLRRDFEMLEEVTPANPQIPSESKDVQRFARVILRSVGDALVPYVNALITRDNGNMAAMADIVVNGETVAPRVPAVALIALENDFRELLTLVTDIPEAPPGERWVYDENSRVLVSGETRALRTTKKRRPIITVQETDKHPAQFHVDHEDVPIATIVARRYHGGMLLADKRALIESVQEVFLAIQRAREEANAAFETEPVVDIGERLVALALPGVMD
jgi:hypothetical protein